MVLHHRELWTLSRSEAAVLPTGDDLPRADWRALQPRALGARVRDLSWLGSFSFFYSFVFFSFLFFFCAICISVTLRAGIKILCVFQWFVGGTLGLFSFYLCL